MKRRDFVKSGLLVSSGILMFDPLTGCMEAGMKGYNDNKYYKGFIDPPVTSRMFVRWWWNGDRLDKTELLRELDVMKSAGIGGVEINPIAFPSNTDPVGYKSLTVFGDKWLDMLETALQGAKKRGMICDMIVGSGWPFGGEFLKKDDQTQMVTIETINLKGGKEYSFSQKELLDKVAPDFSSKNTNVYKDLVMVRLAPSEAHDFTEGQDFPINSKESVIKVKVPDGEYILYFVVKLTGYMVVINGAPGAAGPVLNHYSKPAVENYLERISGKISGKVGNMGEYIRAMFCDSMELEGANWNDDLPVEFEKRRGYSMLPYLPFILKKIGAMGNPVDKEYGTKFPKKVTDLLNQVDLDFYKTRLELFKERFLETFTEWCHKNNVKSRMQAYGRGMHPLEASMSIDIPECETWARKEVGREYPNLGLVGRAPTMVNKYVSSSANLTGKNIVSCEEETNTTMAFMLTLENIKIIGDQSNLSGVNHSILHGFNYSPLKAKFPGWIRYGTYFNERNTWWPWFRSWADYKARLSYIFQESTPRAEIAVLQPLTDLWLKDGPQRDPFPQKWYPDYQNNLWEVINQNGCGCDYVSESIICSATFKDGRMIYNNCSYHTLLLPEIETLDLKTVKSLSRFAEAGGQIVFIGKKPYKSPFFIGMEKKSVEIEQNINELIENKNGQVCLYPSPKGNLIEWFGKMQKELQLKQYVNFDQPNKYLNQISYLLGNNPVYFMANTSLSEDISVEADFFVENKKLQPWLWEPETGERFLYPKGGRNNHLKIDLPRATSLLLVFDKKKEGKNYKLKKFQTDRKEITGSWNLDLNHIDGSRKKTNLSELKDLSTDEELKSFAGTVIYEKTFTSDKNDYRYIDLGNVQGIAELTLNGKKLGDKWYGDYVYEVEGILKKGENELSIRLTTITGNYLKSLKNNAVAQRWTGGQSCYPMGIIGPVELC